jgi:GTP-binding protein Era
MLIEHQNPHNKSMMVGVVGIPNVGKSSLINTFLGFDLAIVTPKPQTTRNRYHCVVTVDNTEIIFVDTPGLHRSSKEINTRMNFQAQEILDQHDLNLLLVDLLQDPVKQLNDLDFLLGGEWGKGVKNYNLKWIVFTKSDVLSENKAELRAQEYFNLFKEKWPHLEKYFVTSARKEDGLHLLLGALCDKAQPGPHLYPKGEVSNRNERFFVAEYIREVAMKLLREELPYEITVVIESFESGRNEHRVSAAILVNRASQRSIVVGKGGQMIKEIGIGSRKKIEALLGGVVHLNLHVKVSEGWQKNNFVLEEIGLPRTPQSTRVWRKQ